MSVDTTPLSAVEIVTEVRIAAARDTVWSVLTQEPAPWWPPAYFTDARGPQRGGFRIEARLGGRVFEDWGDGNGLMWGTVIGLDRGRFLQIVGDSSPAWGGPSRNFQTYRLEDDGRGTKLRFEHAVFGRVDEATLRSLDEGWRYLLEQGLRRWCETGTLAGAPPAPGC